MKRALAAGAILALAWAWAGCGDEPRSAVKASEFRAALAGAPEPLRKLYARPNQVVDGGPDAFRRQVEALRGYPVVVNKWASWCGPCRLEFPHFQRLARTQGKRVAFLGVDSLDARTDAQDFLEKFPVPYPSYFDPKGKVAAVFRGDRVSPTTAFYDGRGELRYTKQGPYKSAADLERDIRRYTR